MPRTRSVGLTLLGIALLTVAAAAQARQYRARISVMPLDVAMQATVAGSGVVNATLNGTTLTINGTFTGLKSPATVVRLHDSPKAGMRGKPIADLKLTPGTSGTITGSIELTPDQVTALNSIRLYVQLHSEKAPDGNLWGWLFLQEGKK